MFRTRATTFLISKFLTQTIACTCKHKPSDVHTYRFVCRWWWKFIKNYASPWLEPFGGCTSVGRDYGVIGDARSLGLRTERAQSTLSARCNSAARLPMGYLDYLLRPVDRWSPRVSRRRLLLTLADIFLSFVFGACLKFLNSSVGILCAIEIKFHLQALSAAVFDWLV